MSVAGILLAAGQSRRFGTEDKLLADLRGRPLVAHAADALRGAGCDRLIAVTGSGAVAAVLEGFEIVAPEGAAQAHSLRAGILRAAGATRALVVLGDMPFVTSGHLRRVVAACRDDAPAASSSGAGPMPPACFPAALFKTVAGLQGDRGARGVLRGLSEEALVPASEGELRDIDTEEDLFSARA